MSDNLHSNSVVVIQFLAIVRGEMPVHVPANVFQTEAVIEDDRYCLKCCAVRVWDVWQGRYDGLAFMLGRCRACGKEVTL